MASIAVTLPELGESVVEGTIAAWAVREGDRVELDQPLVEITTDKADTEIPAPVAGVVDKILVSEGDTVPVGADLLLIAPDTDAAAREPEDAAAPEPRAPAALETRATPVAKRAAVDAGVDLAGIDGTGPAGRVTRRDVEAHAAPSQPPAARSVAARPAFLSYALERGDRVIPMSPLRKIVAEHMVLSKRVSPHVGTVAEIDMGEVARVRAERRPAFEARRGFSLRYLPFVVHATVRALREFPALNASVLDDAIVEKRNLHIGIAVETEKGLVVPVIRHADRLSLAGIAESIEDLSQRARSKRLSADELKGGTFTVSNPGRHGNLYGFAIINQPQVGILRMGEIVKRPVVRSVDGEDAIAVRPMMYLALSYDHRAVDGAPANGFLHRVHELLERAEFDL
ncbi:MAG: 2-oxo acid dehydrogenase subunit E2 [Deltaproteobacteria bacterium]|nr:MAG: 2-oxo acid dehydrogenase subunit E2 [Deltaproteobacteria bacterium]